MRKPLLLILNCFTIVAMLFAASQLVETKVKAERPCRSLLLVLRRM